MAAVLEKETFDIRLLHPHIDSRAAAPLGRRARADENSRRGRAGGAEQ